MNIAKFSNYSLNAIADLNLEVSQSVPDTTPLSKEEKRSLGQRIRSLNPKYLKGIVKIVHPDQKLVSSTLKFDINKLPPHISRELSKYVDQ